MKLPWVSRSRLAAVERERDELAAMLKARLDDLEWALAEIRSDRAFVTEMNDRMRGALVRFGIGAP